MKTKILTTILLAFCLINYVKAQDIITRKNGQEIKAKILEVTETEIKYKSFSNLDGPTFTISKENVFMIKYQNGEKDVFSNEKVTPTPEVKKPEEKNNSFYTKPQNENKTRGTSGFISLGGGVGLPMGEFASTSYADANAGYAKVGYNLQLSAGIPIAKSNVGFAIKIEDEQNDIDLNTYTANTTLEVRNTMPNASLSISSSGRYGMLSYMGGLFITIPANDLSVDFRLMAGQSDIQLPNLDVSEFYTNSDGNYVETDVYQSTSAKSSLAINFGTSLRYSFSDNFCGLVNFDFFHTKIDYSSSQNVITYVRSSTDYSILDVSNQSNYPSGTQPISLLNISIGFGYQFGK